MSSTYDELEEDTGVSEEICLRTLGAVYGFKYVDFDVENLDRRTNVIRVEIKFKDNAALRYFYRTVMQRNDSDFTNVRYPDDLTVVCDLTTNLVSRLWDINTPGSFLPTVDPVLIIKYGGVSTLIFYIHDLLDQAVIDIKNSVIVKP